MLVYQFCDTKYDWKADSSFLFSEEGVDFQILLKNYSTWFFL